MPSSLGHGFPMAATGRCHSPRGAWAASLSNGDDLTPYPADQEPIIKAYCGVSSFDLQAQVNDKCGQVRRWPPAPGKMGVILLVCLLWTPFHVNQFIGKGLVWRGEGCQCILALPQASWVILGWLRTLSDYQCLHIKSNKCSFTLVQL